VRHLDGSTTWTSPVGRSYHRPSPHEPPPHVDLHAELPPVRPRPGSGTPSDDAEWRSWDVAAPLDDDLPDHSDRSDEDEPPPF
jgi:hypothetical protein